MLESVLMANEVIEEVRRSRRSGVCLKVDFEKAYDSIRWSFLLDMLHRMGFHSKWIKWVKGCLESATVSVLVNGSPAEEFRPSRGLRQGDPLAPFLFLIVVEGLDGLVRNALKENMLNVVCYSLLMTPFLCVKTPFPISSQLKQFSWFLSWL